MTKQIKGAEIFAEGEWNNIKFGSDDLDTIVSSFNALGLSGKVPLKLGHEGDDPRGKTSQLALGWVKKIYREGKKLLADFDMPDKAYALVGDGFLRFVSVELLRDVKASTRHIPWVLDAVALLGSDQPAVGILKDLQALTMARVGDSFPHSGRVAFARADLNYQHMEKMTMAEDNGTAIRELADQLAQLRIDLNKAQGTIAAKDAKIAELSGVATQFTVLRDEVKKDKMLMHRKSITDRLEALVKSEDIQPRVRETFERINGVHDDDQVMKLSLDDVEAYAKAYPNPFKKKKDTVNVVSLTRATDDVPAGTDVDAEIRMRVEAQLREDGTSEPTVDDIQKATVRLFRANPDLANRYRAATNVVIAHPSARQ